MKITNMKIEPLRLKLLKPFTVALGTMDEVQTVLVQIETDEGISGIGEGAPFAPVTGETIETALPTAHTLSKLLIGENPLQIEKIHHIMDQNILGNTSVKAAVDIALHDILGKKAEAPLYQLLGGYKNAFATDMTIGIDSPEKMAAEAKEKVADGFQILKIKAGMDVTQDIAAIRLIREAIGDDIRLRVDANQGWTAAEALQFMQGAAQCRVDAIEQPLPYWDIEGMAYTRSKGAIPIMADESAHSPQDAMRIIRQDAADVINIKLMKSAGLYKAEKINAIAESAGLHCMVGCMLESKIGITAGASLVAAKKNITEADMDSFMHIKDPGIKGGLSIEKGIITLPEAPGLGIDCFL